MLITTIIPTLCQTGRREALIRAIESIHQASKKPVKIIVVVNGQRFDTELLDTLRARQDIEVIQIADGSLIKAHLVGRREVVTEYFSFLDDDDEYLPNALDLRMSALQKNAKADLVVTNGYSCATGHDRILYSRLSHVESNPLAELFNESWLHNCNHLFRSVSVTEKYFENAHAYMEWTWLAFRLALNEKNVAVIDTQTFRYNNTPESLSKSSNFLMARVKLYERMLPMNPGKEIEKIIKRRMSSAWHDISVFELSEGNRPKAIKAHFRSLNSHWTGLKFLSYTRHLIA